MIPAHPPEPLVAEQLALQPVYQRTSCLLGQLAGILLLRAAGADPDRGHAHLPALGAQYAAACDAYRRLETPRHLAASFRAIGEALRQIGAALGEFDARAPRSTLPARLQAARRALQQGSRPALGLLPIDLDSACCAGHGHFPA